MAEALCTDYASDGVIMISSDEISSQSEPGTPEKPKEKKARGRYISDDDSDLDDLTELLGSETPLYDTPKHGYSALEILQIMLQETPSSKMCTKKPHGVQNFASFVVDLKFVAARDLYADDNGAWTTSSPRRKYVVEKEDGEIIGCRVSASSTDDFVTVCRQYGTHKGTPEFRRIIVTARDSSNKQLPKAIVQYYFTGEKVPITIPPHGNAKADRPYCRTQPSTLQYMKQECKKKQPSEVYNQVLHAGGSKSSLSEEPRNKQQIYNARKLYGGENAHSKDELFDLLEKLKSHQCRDDGGFLREIVMSSSPSAILANKQQLDDLLAFCCRPNYFDVLGVDATFELGDFYVTLTTYHNPLLINPRSKKSPVFLGPAFIHMQRRFEDYYTFFSGLLKLEPKLSSLGAFGTDGEEGLVKALRACFPEAVGLRCFLHRQRNIEDHLKSTSATSTERKEIMRDIFGMQEGEVFNMGLVDAATEEEFDLQLQKLHNRWELLVPGFHNWFTRVQADSFRTSMITSVRVKANLGSPPSRYTTNANESANCTVKRWVGFSKSSWPSFVDRLQNLVEAQQLELSRAMYKSGEYLLAPHVVSFEVDHLKWHHMTNKQRVAHIGKMVSKHCHSKGSTQCKMQKKRLCRLSVAAADTELSTVPLATAQCIWDKAEKLLNDPDAICPAPGNASGYMVLSSTSKKPHFVQVNAGGKVSCDEQCLMWRGRRICSHAVAVAELAQVLPQFLRWIQKAKPECNITKMVTTPKEKRSAGTKAGKPSRIAGSFRQTTPITTYRSRVNDVCEPPHAEQMDDARQNVRPVISVDASHSDVQVSGSIASSFWCPPTPYTYMSQCPPSSPYATFSYSPSPYYQVNHPPYGSFSSPACTSVPSPVLQQRPYIIKLLNNRIKKCSGCKALFTRKVDGSPPDPPNNLVIAHEERRPFSDTQNVMRMSRLQNVYYHTNISCIRRQDPSFVSTSIELCQDVDLLPVHKKYLMDHLGWSAI